MSQALLAATCAAALPLCVLAAQRSSFRARVGPLCSIPRDAETWASGSSWLRLPMKVRRLLARPQVHRPDDVLAALDVIGQALRGGRSLLQAIDLAGQRSAPFLAADLRRVVDRARHGSGLVDALRHWGGARAEEPTVRMVAAALAAAAVTGGPALPAVEVVRGVVADQRALAGEIGALTAQARASAAVVGLAPVAMALLASVADRTTAAFLFTTRQGWVMLGAGLLLDALGVWWMAILIRRRQ
ncbi:MAG: type II secretion system F family protein [Acidimicrobiales bacterium]